MQILPDIYLLDGFAYAAHPSCLMPVRMDPPAPAAQQ